MVEHENRSIGRPATLYDVAAAAGVSHQTVSRVVKGHSNIRPEIRERIDAAIAQLNYRPNLVARSLATSRSHRIGALVYELLATGPSKIIEGASIRAREAGYLLDIVSLDPENDSGISEAIGFMSQSNLAGLLAFTPTDRVWRAVRSASFVVPVSFESETDPVTEDGLPTMGEAGVDLVIDHLAGLGHRTYFHIAGPDGWLAARGRARAYERELSSRGLRSLGTVSGDWSAQSGYSAALQIPVDEGVTAVVAANDQIALGAIAALEDRGYRVPGAVSVVGFDDIPESNYFRPPLTTVHFQFAEHGRLTVDRLLARIAGEEPSAAEASAPVLVIRSSSGPVPLR